MATTRTLRSEGYAWGMLIVRVMFGLVFTIHGAQKVFGAWGGPGLETFATGIAAGMGFPVILGYAAALFEFVGGVMVLLGVAAELGALLQVPVMAVAVFKVHWAGGYLMSNQGYEYALNMLLCAFAIIAAGPGKLALWDAFGRLRDRSLCRWSCAEPADQPKPEAAAA